VLSTFPFNKFYNLKLVKDMKPIKKAVFPVAGLGTRFLPATKAMPKEMLTVVDKPLIQIVVEEAREAGIDQLIFVTGRNKGIIEDHFDIQYELEATLKLRGKKMQIDLLKSDLPRAGQTSFTRQQEPLGLGHAIWCARHIVGDEPFAVLLPDMIMKSNQGCLTQMLQVYAERGGGNVIAVEHAPWEHVHRYGVVAPVNWKNNHFTIKEMVEKPDRAVAPSNLIISGRYILQPEIFAEIEKQKPGAGGEIQITDAMISLMKSQEFHGLKYEGETFDCGDKLGFLAANVAFALENPEIAAAFREMLQKSLIKHDASLHSDLTGELNRILEEMKNKFAPEEVSEKMRQAS
jgi:UTP--glucose-1-phosphate uridylyltransferase